MYCSLELCQHLDSCLGLGIENYGVSMTTLNEVFPKLEGKSTIDESGKKMLENYHGKVFITPSAVYISIRHCSKDVIRKRGVP